MLNENVSWNQNRMILQFHHEENKIEPYSESWMPQAGMLYILLHWE